MMIKFLRHGKGSAYKAMQYLLAKHDHLGQVRADVQALRGNGELFAAIADSSGFSQRYTSAVIAFAPTDEPTEADIEEVLDSFESLAFAGLQKEDYHIFAVLHEEDDGSKHIHVLIPRVHLGTQKSLNIAPPGHTSTFYPWRDYWNEKKGWASPKDPLRRRAINVPQHELRLSQGALKQGLELEKNPRELLASTIEAAVYTGVAVDRGGVERFLREQVFKDDELGVVSRVTKNAISVRLRDTESGELSRPMRLTGAFFDHDFNAEQWLALQKEKKKEEPLSQLKEPDLALLKELEQAIETKKEQRKRYNERVYKSKQTEPVESTPQTTELILKVHYGKPTTTAIAKESKAAGEFGHKPEVRGLEAAIAAAQQHEFDLRERIAAARIRRTGLEEYQRRVEQELNDRNAKAEGVIEQAREHVERARKDQQGLERSLREIEEARAEFEAISPFKRPRKRRELNTEIQAIEAEISAAKQRKQGLGRSIEGLERSIEVGQQHQRSLGARIGAVRNALHREQQQQKLRRAVKRIIEPRQAPIKQDEIESLDELESVQHRRPRPRF